MSRHMDNPINLKEKCLRSISAPDSGRNHGRDDRLAPDCKAEINRNTHREGQKRTFIATMII